MAEAFLRLSTADRLDDLGVAADLLGQPPATDQPARAIASTKTAFVTPCALP
jgi:hypothetical protein